MLRSSNIPFLFMLLLLLVLHSIPIQAWSYCIFGQSPGQLATCSGICQLSCHDRKTGKADKHCMDHCIGSFGPRRNEYAMRECVDTCDLDSRACASWQGAKSQKKQCAQCKKDCKDWYARAG